MTWPFINPDGSQLRMFGYDFIMADPPWEYENYSEAGMKKNPGAHYETMTIEEICALPVMQLARRDCLLWLWGTFPLLLENDDPSQSPLGRVMKAWGFRYSTGGVWAKRTKYGKRHYGTGYRMRSSCEPFLIGIAGSPVSSSNVRNFIDARAREHSRKPDKAYRMAEEMMPRAYRADLFGCETRPGWEQWCLDAGLYDDPDLIKQRLEDRKRRVKDAKAEADSLQGQEQQIPLALAGGQWPNSSGLG